MLIHLTINVGHTPGPANAPVVTVVVSLTLYPLPVECLEKCRILGRCLMSKCVRNARIKGDM